MTTTAERLSSVARENLARTATFTLTRDDGAEGDGLTLDGYATTFNSPTLIDSWEGRFFEVGLPGSWKRTLRSTTPKLQFDHGMHPLIGSIPIGRITSATEEAAGVHVVARLTDNWLVEPVRMAIAEEAIDGMSFRFSVVREEWRDFEDKTVKPEDVLDRLWSSYGLPDDELMTRYLKEVKVSELGPVVWPAYRDTSVGVRSKVTIDLASIGTDREQRQALAQAVFMADLAERGDMPQNEDDPHATEAATDEAPSEQDARAVTDDSPGKHSSPNPSSAQRRREREIALLRARSDLALKGATRDVG